MNKEQWEMKRILQTYALELGCTEYLNRPDVERKAVVELEALIASKVREAADEIGKIQEIQGIDGTWNSDLYHLGLYNGLELATSILRGVEPKYRSLPALQSREQYDRIQSKLNKANLRKGPDGVKT